MLPKKWRGHSVKLGALLHIDTFVIPRAEIGLLNKILSWLSFWVWAFNYIRFDEPIPKMGTLSTKLSE